MVACVMEPLMEGHPDRAELPYLLECLRSDYLTTTWAVIQTENDQVVAMSDL